ncbi:hypothetical protein CEXT_688591 [Caerostris extrusa]|uniref:Uncharacterized protein n=1 Tax=Caerostris extrusa TaxID=172846 RepID=A0AAV4SL79_CAEEX|nr:hypothetical protein CEXT_688591 [Caerostris extrusa]
MRTFIKFIKKIHKSGLSPHISNELSPYLHIDMCKSRTFQQNSSQQAKRLDIFPPSYNQSSLPVDLILMNPLDPTILVRGDAFPTKFQNIWHSFSLERHGKEFLPFN